MKKTISKIAKTELYNLFFSPIAWFLLVAFLFQTGYTYTMLMDRLLSRQSMGGPYAESMNHLTRGVFVDPGGIFSTVAQQLYLFMPLLTMGLIAREINNGTIKLLYSSPVKVRQIVLGKFLAIMIFNLLFIAITGMFVITAMFNIQSADIGMMLSGMLGLYLLLGAFSAIGLFLSCLTSYQIVAAVGTVVTLGLLNYMGSLWQEYDFFRDLTYFLSMVGRVNKMLVGLISTKDLIYFVVIIYLFLAFSVYRLQGLREATPAWVKARRYVLTLAGVLVIGYLTSRPGFIGYYDATHNKENTLSRNAQKIIGKMNDAPLEVTVYANFLDYRWSFGSPANRNEYLGRWEAYQRFKPDIHYKFVYYYDSTSADMFRYYPDYNLRKLAEKYAKSQKIDLDLFQTPEQIRKQIDLRPERNRFVMQLKYKGKTTFLRVFDDMQTWPGETEASAAFQRLQDDHMPKIAFVSGDGERSIEKVGDKEYRMLPSEISFRYALVNQGFDVMQLSLRNEEIPTDIATLVLADPRAPLDSTELGKLQRYVAGGGNLLIALDSRRRSLLEPVLQPLGVQVKEGMLVQQSKDFAPDLVLTRFTDPGASFLRILKRYQQKAVPVSMPGAVALSYNIGNGYDVRPLLITDSAASWLRKAPLPDDALPEPLSPQTAHHGHMAMGGMAVTMSVATATTSPDASVTPAYTDTLAYDPGNGDERGIFPTALSMRRTVNGKEQHIVIAGNADFISNIELARNNPRTGNFVFATGVFSWLTGGRYPIDTYRPEGNDTRLQLTDARVNALKVFFKFVLPGLVAVFATILLVRRKRK